MCAREGFAWGRGPLRIIWERVYVCACVYVWMAWASLLQSAQHHHSDHSGSLVRIVILILLLLILPITHSPVRGGSASQENQGEPDYGGNNYEDYSRLMASVTGRAHTRTH